MNISEFLERFGRTLLEAPLAGKKPELPPELAEIRLAAIDSVREKTYRSGGRKVFPYDLLRIRMRGVEESRLGLFQGRFFRQYLEHEVRAFLRGAACRYPESLRIEVQAAADLPLPGEAWLTVEVASQEAPCAPEARLVTSEGKEFPITKARTNIGRVTDVYRSGGLYRRNDIVLDHETVSREHAHIQHDRATGEYRLFNDRWYARGPRPAECGIWIVRAGMSQQVHRDSRGAKLEDGDEIHFGEAVLRFQLSPRPPAEPPMGSHAEQ
jgi:hypothetical protein